MHAENVVLKTYGVRVSTVKKGENLKISGRNLSVNSSYGTVADLQGSESEETFAPSNLINSISSSSVSDSQIVEITGHTINGSGILTRVKQFATLNGRSKVTLGTPLARVQYAEIANSGYFDSPQDVADGDISIYDDTGGVTLGRPNDDENTKLIIPNGLVRSYKGAGATADGEYLFISSFSAASGDSGWTASYIGVRIETRNIANGGVWIPHDPGLILATDAPISSIKPDPLLIVPPNHDIRIQAATNSSTAEAYAVADGFLATV